MRSEIGAAWGRGDVDVGAEVQRLSALAADTRAHGVVCSGPRGGGGDRRRSATGLQSSCRAFAPRAAPTQDQARVVTPRQAREAGASYVIIGRIVTAAPDRRAAMDAVLRELA